MRTWCGASARRRGPCSRRTRQLRRLAIGLAPALAAPFAAKAALAQPEPRAIASPSLVTVSCASLSGERQHCPAYTDNGVVLLRSTGTAACLLGRSWGYDSSGVWVTEGCAAEFGVGSPAPAMEAAVPPGPEAEAGEAAAYTAEPAPDESNQPTPRVETWGSYDPGTGFLLARGKHGELSLSMYALLRYINQNDEDQVFTDHLGRERAVDPRNDIFSQRILIWLKGWVGNPKLVYTTTVWTVNATDQKAIFANLGYQFSKKFSLYGGVLGNPGTRSMLGSHPYWLGNDRVMADEFFRPYFGTGVYAIGEAVPGLWYEAAVTNSNSALGSTAVELDRKFTRGGSLWWMPTTKEFGPRGAYGDFELHDKVATRFGMSATFSPEQAFRAASQSNPENTTLRLADSVNLFETGALAPGVTIDTADFAIVALDAGMKYRGFFLQAEYFARRLDAFVADGPLPVREVEDDGFYVQSSFYPIPKKLEVYASTSQIYGDKDAGFRNSSEYILGGNYYFNENRNYRMNLQLMEVNRSPVSSAFGYYTAGQDGFTAATALSIFF